MELFEMNFSNNRGYSGGNQIRPGGDLGPSRLQWLPVSEQ